MVHFLGVASMTFPQKTQPQEVRLFFSNKKLRRMVMKQARFTEEQIIGILNAHERGLGVQEL